VSIVPPGAPGTAPSGDATAPAVLAGAGTSSASRRFLLGLLTMAVVVALAELYFVIGWDLPDESGARAWAPHLFGAPLIALLIGLPLAVGVAIGWAWRGAAVVGATVGVLVGSVVAVFLGDPVTMAIDPRSLSLAEGTEGAAAMLLVGASFGSMIGVPLAGAIGWAVGAASSRSRVLL
jgi:hypothetical protein